MGNFYWKARGKWAAQVTLSNGKRSTATCPHLHAGPGRGACQEARDLLAELEGLRQRQAPANARTLSLGQYLKRWLADVEGDLAPATYRHYESVVRSVDGPLGNRRMSELSVADVRLYLRDCAARGLSGITLRHHRATLRKALNDGVRDGLVARNVAALVEGPKVRADERPILTADQCRTLIDGTRADRMHAFYVLAVTVGMREAEMLGLTWEDVDLGTVRRDRDGDAEAGSGPDRGGSGVRSHAAANGLGGNSVRGSEPSEKRPVRGGMGDGGGVVGPRVTVRHTLQRVSGEYQLRQPKTPKSKRVIPLPPIAVEALIAHRKRQMEERLAAGAPGRDGLVFTTANGLPVSGSHLRKTFREHLRRLGLPQVTIHDLRHSCATLLFAIGVPIEVISDILGHSTTRVTADLYRHRVPELAEAAMGRMQEAVGG